MASATEDESEQARREHVSERGLRVRFEWDRRKAASNAEKHGVSFEDAMTVFLDPPAATFPEA
jgi:hypothetical protein